MTLLGLLLFPLGFALFLMGRRPLFWATVVTAGAYDTALVSLGTPLRPFYFFGVLLIARFIVDGISQGAIRFRLSPPGRAAVAFVFIMLASLVMPIILQRDMYVVKMSTSYLDYDQVTPLKFSVTNIKQVLIPIFMVCAFIVMVDEMRDRSTLIKAVRVTVWASLGILASGFLVQAGYIVFGARFLGWLFVPLKGATAEDLGSMLGRIREYQAFGDLPRMYSVAGEPSYTGSFLWMALGLCAVASLLPTQDSDSVKARTWRWGTLLFGLGILLTGSTTAYIGIGSFVLAIVTMPLLRRIPAPGWRPRRATMLGVGILGGLFLLLLLLMPLLLKVSFADYVAVTQLQKLEGGGSTESRMETISYSMQIFRHSPILGVGYGSHRTGALISSLLSNVGLAGTIAFLWLHWSVFWRVAVVFRRSNDPQLSNIALGLLVAHVTLLPLLFGGLSLVAVLFGWHWMLLALMDATYRVHVSQVDPPPTLLTAPVASL